METSLVEIVHTVNKIGIYSVAIIPALILLLLYYYYYKMALTIATSASQKPFRSHGNKILINNNLYQVYKIHRENRYYRCVGHKLKHVKCKSTLVKSGSVISSVKGHSSNCSRLNNVDGVRSIIKIVEEEFVPVI